MASSIVQGRYMMPPGVQTARVSSSPRSVRSMPIPQKSWPTFSTVERRARVDSTQAIPPSSRLKGACRMDSRTVG